MMKFKVFLVSFLFLFIGSVMVSQAGASDYDSNWPTWRGPLFSGEVVKGNPPTAWSETENVKWKVQIPGRGISSPIIWGDQLFITSAVPTDKKAPAAAQAKPKAGGWMQPRLPEYVQQFVVYSIDKNTGKIIWQKVVREQLPHEGTHNDGSWASQSCVTDGEHLFASFGSYGLYCLDLEGNLIWEKDLGDLYIVMAFGEGSSPALYKKYLIVKRDHEKDSYIYVLDKTNGDILWKKNRDEGTSWSTPLVVEVNGKPQVILTATNKSIAYDLETGDIIWELSGMTRNVIPSPVTDGKTAYLISGFMGAALQAVKLDEAKGDLKDSPALVWTYNKNTPYVPSPLLYNGRLYYFRGNDERLSCLDAKTGKVYYEAEKLDGMKGVYASPVGANGFVYAMGRNGMGYVLKDGTEFKAVSQNTLDDEFDASPAVVGNSLYLRGLKSLYCIAE